ncbi:YdeI/OmpD-associated family protein [Thalassobacterium maritimum]|uniref:YdeI/OmpD-associated family protein n=1 Tax=Thalassobacterium maritimum TaxID=3041265 RepID=UPI002812703F|nr:YdeI/OmpD-associated family protein [Coraliomargarita sp. SDUM461003]
MASLEEALLGYVAQAIEIEKSGKAVSDPKLGQPTYPQELIEAFEQNADFKAAFAALTPGRQRGYLLYFTSAKQSKTKAARIEKCMPKVFSCKGWNER